MAPDRLFNTLKITRLGFRKNPNTSSNCTFDVLPVEKVTQYGALWEETCYKAGVCYSWRIYGYLLFFLTIIESRGRKICKHIIQQISTFFWIQVFQISLMVLADADVLVVLLSLCSFVPTVQLRQRCTALSVCEGAQSPSREEFLQTAGSDFICAQHPSILLSGEIPAFSLKPPERYFIIKKANISFTFFLCALECCQRFILPVWQRCFCRAEGSPGFLPGIWTQTIQDLQTSQQTGQSAS